MPDIDIDFCQARPRRGHRVRHEEVRPRERGADRDVLAVEAQARRAGRRRASSSLPIALGDRIAKLVPDGPGRQLRARVARVARPEASSSTRTSRSARSCRSPSGSRACRATPGMHAAGVVIAPRPIIEYLPLYRTNKDEITTQFDMNAVEKMGLLEDRFPGPHHARHPRRGRSPRSASARASRRTWTTSPLDDEKTFELFRSGKTACVFQFDSSGMRDLLRRAKPRVFADLAALNALYRPGALDAGTVEDYVRRRERHEPGDATRCRRSSDDPRGDARHPRLPGAGHADRLSASPAIRWRRRTSCARRSARRSARSWSARRRSSSRRAVEHGTPKKKAQELWALIEPFARYGFNKSHAVAYALVAYKTGVPEGALPGRFPRRDSFGRDRLDRRHREGHRRLRRRSGIPVLPPDINESGAELRGRRRRRSASACAAIKGVGEAAAEAILAERAEAAVRLLHRLRPPPGLAPRQQARTLDALDRRGRLRLAREEPRDPRRRVRAGRGPARRARARKRRAGQSNLFGGGRRRPGTRSRRGDDFPELAGLVAR